MYFDWNEEENILLKENRKITFEDVVIAIENDKLLDVIPTPSKNFPNQECFVVEIGDYVYLVPFVMDGEKVFLKTIYPSRKQTKFYLRSNK